MENIWNNEILADVLKQGGIVVMPTDTIYGIIGSATNKGTVERIYHIRKRAPEKPAIILLGNEKDLEKFFISLSRDQEKEIKKYWPGPVSIVLDCQNDTLEYLHRGTKTLAFRVPAQTGLQSLLNKTGPLIAPSANPEGFPPAISVAKGKEYFADLVDLYVDGGEKNSKPSKLIQLHKDGSVSILRE